MKRPPKIVFVAQALVLLGCVASWALALTAGCSPRSAPSGPIAIPNQAPKPSEPRPEPAIASYADAVRASVRTGKPLCLIFTASWCAPCRQMHAGTLRDPAVTAALGKFIVWQSDIDRDRELARQYQVVAVPSYRQATSNEKPFKRASGYMSPPQFVEWLTQP